LLVEVVENESHFNYLKVTHKELLGVVTLL
jgi:hypothetical protein